MYDARLLREALDAQLEMVCRFRPDGTILLVNQAYAQTIGSTPEELTGASLWAFVTPEDRAGVEAGMAQLTPDRPVVTIENRLETPDGERWTLWRNRGLKWDAAGRLLEAQSTGYDITERKHLEDQRQLLIEELNHRVRNTLMVVQGMAHQTFRGSAMPEAHLAAFNARLHALAGAHTALSRSNWAGAEIEDVVHHGLAICGDDIVRITLAGPSVRLRPNAAVALALVLHELATNAVKYGALSAHEGTASVTWALGADDRLALCWQERGGPPVVAPTRTGFGTRLIGNSVTRQLEGEVDLAYDPAGLTCRMNFPLHSALLPAEPASGEPGEPA
ncbi:sensor histidine kinase [Novosphingobium bradum]|uniref:histidine kinase n=1 Tax=Novosphingobium bradum TaxID=1737444 RepID=A0ABV7IK79_9SPHN